MAGHSRYTALLDACVLFPMATCDALMSVAVTGIFAAKWTRRIEDEWMRNLAELKGVVPEAFERRRDAMRRACPDWEVEVEAWVSLVDCIKLPDEDDRHVLAAAVAGHTDCIVTSNLKDFPASALGPLGIEAIHPDDFLVAQLELDPLHVLPAFKKMRARLKDPESTPEVFAAAMERNGLTQTAAYLRQASELI